MFYDSEEFFKRDRFRGVINQIFSRVFWIDNSDAAKIETIHTKPP